MEIIPISSESFGTRSFAHFVKTDSYNIFIDPSVALAPRRFGLPPHPLELSAAWKSRQIIIQYIDIADIIIQTHYHADHYTMGIERKYEFTNKEVFETIYTSNRIILAKDPKNNINYRQRRRAYWLWKKKGLDIRVADNQTFSFDNLTISFSAPIPHGGDTKRGYVIEVAIDDGKDIFLYTSDVSGPVNEKAVEFIKNITPDIVFLDGPPYYHPHVSDEEIDLAFQNIKELLNYAKKVYIDHHFLRQKDWKERLTDEIGKKLPAVSEHLSLKPILLEAQRKELHESDPPEAVFYERFHNNQLSELIFQETLKKYNLEHYWNRIAEKLNKIKKDPKR